MANGYGDTVCHMVIFLNGTSLLATATVFLFIYLFISLLTDGDLRTEQKWNISSAKQFLLIVRQAFLFSYFPFH